jgi:molybdopterin-guanine dinucleotide biosynthesis protein A
MKKTENISFYILAGGQNSRMHKKDKGLLQFDDNHLFIEKIISSVSAYNFPVFIVSENEKYNNYAPTIKDITKKIGPMGGVYTALTHAQTPWICNLPCDSPFIHKEDIDLLLNNLTAGVQAVVLKAKEKLFPLNACYHKNCITVLERYIESGNYKMKDFLQQIHIQEIECNYLHLLNINTPQEYQQYLNKTI